MCCAAYLSLTCRADCWMSADMRRLSGPLRKHGQLMPLKRLRSDISAQTTGFGDWHCILIASRVCNVIAHNQFKVGWVFTWCLIQVQNFIASSAANSTQGPFLSSDVIFKIRCVVAPGNPNEGQQLGSIIIFKLACQNLATEVSSCANTSAQHGEPRYKTPPSSINMQRSNKGGFIPLHPAEHFHNGKHRRSC